MGPGPVLVPVLSLCLRPAFSRRWRHDGRRPRAAVSHFAFGVSDFIGGLASRRASAWSVAVVGLVHATVCTAAMAAVTGGAPTGATSPGPAWAGSAAESARLPLPRLLGRADGCGRTRSRRSGRRWCRAAGAASGERPGAWCGPGDRRGDPAIWLVSTSPATDPGSPSGARRPWAGAWTGSSPAWASASFRRLGQVPGGAGLWPLAVVTAGAVPAVVAIAAALRAALVPGAPNGRRRGRLGPFGAAARCCSCWPPSAAT